MNGEVEHQYIGASVHPYSNKNIYESKNIFPIKTHYKSIHNS